MDTQEPGQGRVRGRGRGMILVDRKEDLHTKIGTSSGGVLTRGQDNSLHIEENTAIFKKPVGRLKKRVKVSLRCFAFRLNSKSFFIFVQDLKMTT